MKDIVLLRAQSHTLLASCMTTKQVPLKNFQILLAYNQGHFYTEIERKKEAFSLDKQKQTKQSK
jgi:hypothetical protein